MPSIKQALNSSDEAFTGKFKLGTILFIHSTNTARLLAGDRAKREEDIQFKGIKQLQLKGKQVFSYLQCHCYELQLVQKHPN